MDCRAGEVAAARGQDCLRGALAPSSCASAPQVDAERCALTFAPENEDPDQVGVNRSWRKTTNPRRREVDR